MIIELKKADNFLEMDAKCDVALEQIEDKNYAEGLLAEGYQSILKYGISFCKKSCRVKTSAAEHQI